MAKPNSTENTTHMNTIHFRAPVRVLGLCVALGAALAGTAHAQSITLYGVADVYAEVGKGDRHEISLN